MSYRGKRTLDVVIAAPLFVVTLPLQVLLAAAVRTTMGTPVFFLQDRPGLHEEPFTLIKFRTMLEPDASLGLIDDNSRLTWLGRFMRSTSVDELPTLWNVLKGDLSLVGPRPLLTSYVPLYTPEQARRHDVRPGLTGLAQINGRNNLSWDERFIADLTYIQIQSLAVDLQILAKTVPKVLGRRDVEAHGQATVERFTGSHGGSSG